MEILSRAAAKTAGRKRYFTGKPCVRGHVAERRAGNGLCLECERVAVKAWRAANPDKASSSGKAYKAANRDKSRAKNRAYREANTDKVRAWKKISYERNKEKDQEKNRARFKAWRQANPSKMRELNAKWRKENPDKGRDGWAIRRARKRDLAGVVSRGIRAKLRALQKGKCAACHVSLKKAGEHLDHVMPLALGGLHDDTNLQLLCPPCNHGKGAKHPGEWARELGRLL